jgi:hypothetical protein
MCKIAHGNFCNAATSQPSFREKNSSRKYAIVRLHKVFSISLISVIPRFRASSGKQRPAGYSGIG